MVQRKTIYNEIDSACPESDNLHVCPCFSASIYHSAGRSVLDRIASPFDSLTFAVHVVNIETH